LDEPTIQVDSSLAILAMGFENVHIALQTYTLDMLFDFLKIEEIAESVIASSIVVLLLG
jgi:hypothetical protein